MHTAPVIYCMHRKMQIRHFFFPPFMWCRSRQLRRFQNVSQRGRALAVLSRRFESGRSDCHYNIPLLMRPVFLRGVLHDKKPNE